MNTTPQTPERNLPTQPQYALREAPGFWDLTFDGRPASFPHQEGALYVACLLLDPPREPLHAVALALASRRMSSTAAGAATRMQERSLGLDEAEAVRSLRRRERQREAVLDDEDQIEPVKPETSGELEEIQRYQRQHPWRSQECAGRCVRAVTAAIKRLHSHLAGAVDAKGEPDGVLRAFARHLHKHLLIPSERGGGQARGTSGLRLGGLLHLRAAAGRSLE